MQMAQQAQQAQAQQRPIYQPMQPMQPVQPVAEPTLTVHILMSDGREAKEVIYARDMPAISEALNEAISSCTALPFGNRVLNGRYILEYMYY
jgi:hypothetical protein